ncbi:hypothetical protein CSC2_00820 [Clostridium zeae]|uniref:Transposase n=1 Tax=Clostridium zeae TaxID=2759022 RepID=A0ABQ1E488_9CLOT|nr:hypothetical protein CSC2_00820 [Clostridium zeae]
MFVLFLFEVSFVFVHPIKVKDKNYTNVPQLLFLSIMLRLYRGDKFEKEKNISNRKFEYGLGNTR